MTVLRKGETGKRAPTRCDRFFKLHNQWFFATREGASIGPFDSKNHAQDGANTYIEFAMRCEDRLLDHFRMPLQFGT